MSAIKSRRSRGFTLIEVLVVLMIMGLLIGLVSVVVGPDDRGLLRLEADRLAQLLDSATSEARLTGRGIAWTAEETGYRFWRAGDDATWSEIEDVDLLRARSLPQGMKITALQVENTPPRGVMRLEFSPQSSFFAFTISMSFGRERCAVAGSPVGEVRVLPADGKRDEDVALH